MPAGRYAPSPTGQLHVGNLRTGMLAWLAARASDRPLLLRVEDLDRVRSGAEQAQLAELAAVGITWDAEPVRQSERTALYEDAVAALRAHFGEGAVYECYCSRKDIAEASSAPNGPAEQHDDGSSSASPSPLRPPGFYPGTCRGMSAQDRERRRAERPAALRVDAALIAGLDPGQAPETAARDLVHGTVTGLVDDVVVRRNDGAYAYNLAVVVDDLDQGVDQVVRGDDLLDSSPRQRWLAQALCTARGVACPDVEYLHVPLVVNTEGRRLAKRDGAVTLEDLGAALGLDLPGVGERVRDTMLASLGLPSGPLGQAIAAFDPRALPRGPWVFDEAVFTG